MKSSCVTIQMKTTEQYVLGYGTVYVLIFFKNYGIEISFTFEIIELSGH